MKALILTVGLGLLAALLPTTWSEQSLDLSGKWYIKALILEVEGHPMMNVEASTPLIVTPLDGHRLLHTQVTLLMQGQCTQINRTFKKTQEPGKYINEVYSGTLYLKTLPVNGHIVSYLDMVYQGNVIHTTKLLGRDMSMNQEAVEAFKNQVSANGYNPNHVVVPKQTDTCPVDEQ